MTDTHPPSALVADDEAETTLADRILAPVRWVFRRLALVLLAVLVAMPAIQVVLREILRQPFVGAEELARFMLICVVFVTLPTVVASGANVRMEEVLNAMPRMLKSSLRTIIALTGTLAFGVAAISVAVATLRNLNNATPTLQIPYWVFFSAAFLGLALSALECAIQLAKGLMGRPIYVLTAEEREPDPLEEL
ncbi:TRAP transporter small permease [Acuticoccus kandeliae]|uniref:TRAP transporter small permease n=1 Tax=Acuticoccus kandeliae TaxID=2073160 RepID=UPI000D3EAF8F|nr:TRAP transporter small permease [Acuticoccus kandeliae]